MNERINWIDWAKAFCMTVVVFCHLPQQEGTFYLQYLASVILSTFFFISGYLKKRNLSLKESAKKYGYSLLIPYIIYKHSPDLLSIPVQEPLRAQRKRQPHGSLTP